jgi:RND superfamily putative drug exporter
VAELVVVPSSAPQSPATEELVRRLRDDVLPSALAHSGIRAHVGGATAALIDQAAFARSRLPVFVAGVVTLAFLLLLWAFRSPLIALKAAIMNLLAVAAAYGVTALFARGGFPGELVGIAHQSRSRRSSR